MKFSNVIKYYKKKGVAEKIIELCKGREVIPRYWNGSFGKRPDTLMFANDVHNLVKDGATSFHVSEEIWSNPLDLSRNLNRKQMDELREGWDFILDIDPENWEHGRICAKLLVEAVESHGVKSYSIKFSGGSGWHIGVPWKAFPKVINNEKTSKLFPEASRVMAAYLKSLIKDHLKRELLKFCDNDLQTLAQQARVSKEELFEDGELNPYSIIDIDTLLIASRHLYRAPYSFNEKTWLISVPVTKKELDEFTLSQAKPENVKPKKSFLAKQLSPGEASNLITQAMDWEEKHPVQKVEGKTKDYELPEKAVNKEFFPPCIKLILEGLSDGRKRSVFILINFLRTQGWSDSDIKKQIIIWNKRNEKPLPRNYLESQFNWAEGKEKIPPPNCDNKAYYVDIGVCKPDNYCKKIKNPSSYPYFKKRSKKKGKKKKKPEKKTKSENNKKNKE